MNQEIRNLFDEWLDVFWPGEHIREEYEELLKTNSERDAMLSILDSAVWVCDCSEEDKRYISSSAPQHRACLRYFGLKEEVEAYLIEQKE